MYSSCCDPTEMDSVVLEAPGCRELTPGDRAKTALGPSARSSISRDDDEGTSRV